MRQNNTTVIDFSELKEDMKTALKIINSDIGMKNSILSQCDTENPDTKESVDSMRRSIADGERLLTKYADGRLDYETGGEKSGKLTSEIEREAKEKAAKDTEVPEIPPRLAVCPKCGADAAIFVHPAFDGGSYVRCNKCMYSDQTITWAPTDAQAAQKWNNFCEQGKAK